MRCRGPVAITRCDPAGSMGFPSVFSTMQIPSFPEANHPLIQSLNHVSDRDLLALFQRYPEQGKYFVALFCRYSQMLYSIVGHSARSPVQADYLFALTWRHIFYELGGISCRPDDDQGETLQNRLIALTALCVNDIELPPVETINYNLRASSPPLWCYLEQALDLIPPLTRLVLVMADNFHWSSSRIAAYLKTEGENLTAKRVEQTIAQGHRQLEETLPEDIRQIYLDLDVPVAPGTRP